MEKLETCGVMLMQTIWSFLQVLVCAPAILLLVTDQSPSLLLDAVINSMSKCN